MKDTEARDFLVDNSVKAGRLSWVPSSACRCVPLSCFIALALISGPWPQLSDLMRAVNCGVAVFLTASFLFLVLGKEINAGRIRQRPEDLIAHGRLGLILAWGVLQVPMLWTNLRQLTLSPNLYVAFYTPRPYPEITIPIISCVTLALAIGMGIRSPSPEDHVFVGRLIRRCGRFGVAVGAVIGLANLCLLVSMDRSFRILDRGLFLLYLTPGIAVKSAYAGCLAALLLGLVTIRVLSPNERNGIGRATRTGLLIGGMITFTLGFGLALILFLTHEKSYGINPVSNWELAYFLMEHCVTSYLLSAGVFLGGFIGGLGVVGRQWGSRSRESAYAPSPNSGSLGT